MEGVNPASNIIGIDHLKRDRAGRFLLKNFEILLAGLEEGGSGSACPNVSYAIPMN